MITILKVTFLGSLALFIYWDYNLKLKIKNGEYQSEQICLATDQSKQNLKICDRIISIFLLIALLLIVVTPNRLGISLANVPKYIVYTVMLRYVVEYLTLKKYLPTNSSSAKQF